MGIIADLLAAAKGIDTTLETTALDRVVIRELNEIIAQGDAELSAALSAIDEVHSLAQYTSDHTGGTFALTITLANGETFTTAVIVFGASAATIETAIDTAASGVVTGWTNGDITVSGGTLLGAGSPVVLTYDGTSVAGGNHVEVVFDGALLTGGTSASPTESTTTEGQTVRPAWAVAIALGMVDVSEVPVQGVDPGILTIVGDPSNPSYPSEATIRAVADEAAIEDGNVATRDSMLAAARLS